MEKIELKHNSGRVIFSYECEDNSIGKTIMEAVKIGVSLIGVNLIGCTIFDTILDGVDFRYANLSRCLFVNCSLENSSFDDANLYRTKFRECNLQRAQFCDCNINRGVFAKAYLNEANFKRTVFYDTLFSGCTLSSCNLDSAAFSLSSFSDCEMKDSCLKNNYIKDSTFSMCSNIPFVPQQIPSSGEFIGWKRVYNYIVKLRIPKDAERVCAFGYKCRASKAYVVEIFDANTGCFANSVTNYQFKKCIYRKGKEVLPDSYDDNRMIECSHGIHFFLDKQHAIDYIV